MSGFSIDNIEIQFNSNKVASKQFDLVVAVSDVSSSRFKCVSKG